jgi:hypothetical protein
MTLITDNYLIEFPTTLIQDGIAVDFSNPSPGVLKYIGPNTRYYHCAFSFTMSLEGTTNKEVVLVVLKNGVEVCAYRQELLGVGEHQTIAFHKVFVLNTNDEITCGVGSTSAFLVDDFVNFNNCNIVAVGSSTMM